MARIKLELPSQFSFSTNIPIRITDVNYGGHVGNDTILSLLQEARMQFLAQHGVTELHFWGFGLIMSDVAIEFKAEVFYGDTLKAQVTATDFSRVAFDLYYVLSKNVDGKELTVALAKTGMVCFDYTAKKPVIIPAGTAEKLSGSGRSK